ncbi:MAG TPA: SDR family oxidoreductase [Candidatus Corynebacterium gallistercoris]|uniref:SDR family oxidoreductase n=1 Tax=Candidatus Corynebacterium gallistercoris TaxID=2838530 RepID=A0A9D1UQU8_9CORY|nr:SDR family oxidoreductase [Candidatus Corynebacterium gallistercoris]
MKALDFTQETVLITGASAGLGVEFARQLAARGANLVLVARRLDRLNALAADLRADYGVTVTVISKDLAKSGVAGEIMWELSQLGITVTSLINNAGFANYKPFTDIATDQLRNEIAVNVAALVELTHMFLPKFEDRGTGFIVNIASIAGFQPSPGMVVYGASKAFVLSFTEGLWAERKGAGVRILAICPGPTETEFFHVAGSDKADGGLKRMSSEEVVAIGLKTLEAKRPGPSVVTGAQNKILTGITQRMPRRAVAAVLGKMMK